MVDAVHPTMPIHRVALVVFAGLALVLAGCSQTVRLPEATLGASPTAEATVEATPSPTPSPTAKPQALAPEIAEFSQVGESLNARIHNPNKDVGLIRASFELTLLAADGSIISVLGSQGLNGSPFSTIYRLPPGGDFGISQPMDPNGPNVSKLELVVTDDWVDWESVKPPEAVLSNVSLITQDFVGPRLTGRVAVADAAQGPFNVWVQAFVTHPAGLIVVTGLVDCVKTAAPRAFDLTSFANVTGPFKLTNTLAYTTTVPGVTEPAPNNC
jgi:hypothetical protein